MRLPFVRIIFFATFSLTIVLAFVIAKPLLPTFASGFNDKLFMRVHAPSSGTGSSCGKWSVSPSPNGGTNFNYLNAVVASSPTNAWAVGDFTSNNGSPTQQTLVEHWNGKNWSIVNSPNPNADGFSGLYGVTVVSADDVWAVGASGYISSDSTFQTLTEHWNGTIWSVVPSPNAGNRINGLSAVAHVPNSHQLWAVGDETDTSTKLERTLIEYWNGNTWSIVPSPNIAAVNNLLNGVAALSANNIWAIGSTYDTAGGSSQTLIQHWNGIVWSVIASPNPTQRTILNAITRIPYTNQVWSVGQVNVGNNDLQTLTLQKNGKSFDIISSPNSGSGGPNTVSILNGVAGSSATNIWAVGYSQASINPSSPDKTLIEHWNGKRWSIIHSPNPEEDNILSNIAQVPSSSQAWAVGYSDTRGNFSRTLIEAYC